jgi:hypothetical protein
VFSPSWERKMLERVQHLEEQEHQRNRTNVIVRYLRNGFVSLNHSIYQYIHRNASFYLPSTPDDTSLLEFYPILKLKAITYRNLARRKDGTDIQDPLDFLPQTQELAYCSDTYLKIRSRFVSIFLRDAYRRVWWIMRLPMSFISWILKTIFYRRLHCRIFWACSTVWRGGKA